MMTKLPFEIPIPVENSTDAYRAEHFRGPVDLRLDGNEGLPPPDDLLQSLRRIAGERLRRYPSAASLEKRLAQKHGVDARQIIVTAGGDDALDRCCRAVLSPGTSILLTTPTFEMLPRYARLAGAELVELPWMTGPFPTSAITSAVSERVRAIAIVSPNNPTGSWAKPQDLCRVSAAAPNALLIVDAVYSEFSDEDLTDVALELPNVIVIRSFSKAQGLAGLRVGYAIGPSNLIDLLRAAGGPYPVSAISLAVASAHLQSSHEPVDRFVSQVRLERVALGAELLRLGARPLPTQANFILARFENAQWVRDALASLGIGVRQFPNHPALQDCLRITCPGNEPQFARLIGSLQTAMRPEAILFDMDGVLIDVSQSYRRAIVMTAAFFGVTINSRDVAAAKQVDRSNNDWFLTHRILSQHGVDVSVEAVKSRFNMFYNGTITEDGLHLVERLLVDPDTLRRLADKLPLAIVTGRPRAEAERTLERFCIAGFFQTLVCMEDTAAKPSGAPLHLALSRLDARQAWMIGDTRDDVLAARSAGVVSIGVVAPGDDEDCQVGELLLAAGASRILNDIRDLEGLLK